MKKFHALRIIFLILAVTAVFILPVAANSAMTYWYGTQGTGVVGQDEDCPVTVLHETLTYDLSEQPVPGKIDPEHYENSFTAHYTFHNPSDMQVHTLLSFPLPPSPYYLYSRGDYNDSLYEILVNDEPAETLTRFTWKPDGNVFSLEKDLALLTDEYREDSFFRPDLKVTEQTYRVSADESEVPGEYTVVCNAVFANRPDECRVLCMSADGWSTIDEKTAEISEFLKGQSEITFFSFGKSAEPEFRFYANTGNDKNDINGDAELIRTEEMTYEEFVLKQENRPAGMSDIDYYNAFTDMFLYYSGDAAVLEWHEISGNVMKWLQYELVFEPGETLINSVKAPAFPSIDMDYDPVMFIYDYLLSPASTWNEFGTLDIIINTDLYLFRDSFGTFEKTKTGYQAHFDTLPKQELGFQLNESENPEKDPDYGYIIITALLIIIPLAGIVLFVLMIIAVVKLLVKRKKENDEI